MLMSYVGALKSWIYGPILRNLGVSTFTVRLPALLAGVASVWLFFLLLRRVAGSRAALMGCALLATDAMYLLTVCYDWGPVAFQHLLLLGGTLAAVCFFQERRTGFLAAAAFLFGLMVWDKALALWTLSGLGAGVLLMFPREIFGVVSLRRMAIAALFFALGALPLIVYNVASRGGTFSGNFQRNTADIPRKALILERTLAGDGLFGWMSFEDVQTPHPRLPGTALERATARISAAAGGPRRWLFPYLLALALLIAPLGGWRNLRIVLVGVIAMAVAWIQMAINENTGASIHHTILLWPLPQFIVAVSLASAGERLGRAGIRAVGAITAIVALSGALVINEYLVKIVRNGGAPFWTDGIYSLSRYLKDKPASWIFAMDWSIADQLRLLHRGRVLAGNGTDQISKPQLTAEDRRLLHQMLSIEDGLYVAHTPAFEIIPGNNDKLIQYAAAYGYRREVLATIPDSHGRNVYEVYKLVK